MTTKFHRVHNVDEKLFIFCKDGIIRCNTPYHEEVGTWKHTHPRAENKSMGRYARRFVTDLWEGGLYYKGSVCDYTRKGLKEMLVKLVEQKGLDLIVEIK